MNKENKLQNMIFLDFIPIITVIFFGYFSILKWKTGIIPTLIFTLIVCVIIGKSRGYSLKEIEFNMGEGVRNVFPALMTVILVGFIISSWIIGGIIPTMVYFGFKIINPNFFFASAFILTALTAIITGTSFTSIGTIGVSLMIIGSNLGVSSNIVAGAIISGAFLGDKMSPLSDTTNIAATLGKVELFQHIRNMMWDTIPAAISTLIIYMFFIKETPTNESYANIENFMTALNNDFNINPLILAVPIIIVIMSVKRIPSNIVLFTAVILGYLSTLIFQKTNGIQALRNIIFGVSLKFNSEAFSKLFHKGGINEISTTVITIIFIGALTGVLLKCHILKNIFNKLEFYITTPRKLTCMTYFTSILIGIATGAQLLAVILPITIFIPIAEKLGVKNKMITRIAESTGTVGITLVPWSVPALFAAATLKIYILKVVPYLIFPIFMLLFNFLLTICYSVSGKEKNNEA